MKKYELTMLRYNKNEITNQYVEGTYDTLEEAKKYAMLELDQAWREQDEMNKHHSKSELVIDEVEFDAEGDCVDNYGGDLIATIYPDYIIIEEYEEKVKELDNVKIFDVSTLEGMNELEGEFEDYFEFDDLMINLNSDGHIYKVMLNNKVKWFDNAEEVLDFL